MPSITNNDITYNYDVTYSFKDFTGQVLPSANLNGKVIYGSVFAQEIPNRQVFPSGTISATFVKCNLDNVFLAEGNTVIDCSTRHYAAQNDGLDWEIDAEGNAIKILGT